MIADRSIRHVAAEDLAEGILIGLRHMRIRGTWIQFDAVRLCPSHGCFLLRHAQGFPRRRIVRPALDQEDAPPCSRRARRQQHNIRRFQQAGILRAIDEAGEITEALVGPAGKLIGQRGNPIEHLDRQPRFVEKHVVLAAGQPQDGVVLRRRHREPIRTGYGLVEACHISRSVVRRY